MSVTQLGYVGLNVRDLAAWEKLTVQVLGMEARPREADGPLYLRMDERHHRLALYPAKQNSTAYLGWETADEENFAAVCKKVADFGVKVTPGTASEKKARRVLDLIKFRDPAGFPCELFHGPLFDETPFRPGRAMGGFVTGALGVGHVALPTDKPEETARFYREALGFRLSEFMDFADVHITFLHCNPRGHTVGVMNPGLGSKAGELNHIMFQVTNFDDVGQAYDLCMKLDVPILITIGKHTNDKMTSFYLKSPSGFAIEYGYGGIEIDDATWEVQHYLSPSLWGHNLKEGMTTRIRPY